MTTLSLDYETFSRISIDVGTYRYTSDESTRPLLLGYAFDEDPAEVVRFAEGEGLPKVLREALHDPEVQKCAWNAPFEIGVTKHCLGIEVPYEQWYDPMIHAYYLTLPGNLGKAGAAWGIAEDKKKDARGKALIRMFCQPQKPTKRDPSTRKNFLSHPAEWEEFVEYCRQDVEAERALRHEFSKYPMPEWLWEEWVLDQEINAHGLPINLDMVRNAITVRDHMIAHRMEELRTLTGLDNPNSQAQMLKWARKHGYPFTDLKGSHVREGIARAEKDGNELLAHVLDLRSEISRTSVKKYDALLAATDPDDRRLRGTLQFGGAQRTGRECLAEGTLILVKLSTGEITTRPIQDVTTEMLVWDGCAWVAHEGVVFSGDKDVIEHDGIIATAEHIVYLSDAVSCPLLEAKNNKKMIWRGNSVFDLFDQGAEREGNPEMRTYDIINAGPRNRFMANGRIVSNSGRIFQPQNLPRPSREFDSVEAQSSAAADLEVLRPRVVDILYSKPMDMLASCIRPTVQAEPGKLFCDADLNAIENRVLGWGANDPKILDVFRNNRCPYVDFATYMFKDSYENLYAEYKAGDKSKRTLAKPATLGCGYRLSAGELRLNRQTGEMEGTGLIGYAKNMGVDMTTQQAELAVKTFRSVFTDVVEFWYDLEKAASRCIKTGRRQQVGPFEFRMTDRMMRIRLPSGRYLNYLNARIQRERTPWGDVKPTIVYDGLNDRKQWGKILTHGGKLTENIVQAVARDVLFHGMKLARAAGLNPFLHVHDQIVTMEPAEEAEERLAILSECMATVPEWAPGLILAAEGEVSHAFFKT